MLYDGARRFLRQANVAMREGQVERAHNTLRRAELIIAHLDGILDFDQGEVAERLHAIYQFCLAHLNAAARPGRRQARRGQRAAGRAARGVGPGCRGDRPRVSGRKAGGERAFVSEQPALGPYEAIHEHAELELELVGRGETERLAALGERWDAADPRPAGPPARRCRAAAATGPADPRTHSHRAGPPARVAAGGDRHERARQARGRRLCGPAAPSLSLGSPCLMEIGAPARESGRATLATSGWVVARRSVWLAINR